MNLATAPIGKKKNAKKKKKEEKISVNKEYQVIIGRVGLSFYQAFFKYFCLFFLDTYTLCVHTWVRTFVCVRARGCVHLCVCVCYVCVCACVCVIDLPL